MHLNNTITIYVKHIIKWHFNKHLLTGVIIFLLIDVRRLTIESSNLYFYI